MTGFKSKSRYLRLLPGVMLACAGLLVLNASGIVHDAMAQEGQAAPEGAMAPAPKAVNADFAGSDAQASTAAEVDVLTSLAKRRQALDERLSRWRRVRIGPRRGLVRGDYRAGRRSSGYRKLTQRGVRCRGPVAEIRGHRGSLLLAGGTLLLHRSHGLSGAARRRV